MELGNKDRFDISNLTSRPAIKEIFNALGSSNSSVRFIGGCVRDIIIGKSLSDIDIATVFTPEQVIERLCSVGIRTIPTGIKFGTVTAVVNSQHYEITTLRKDIDCDGRHAIIDYTKNWHEDAERRDFTINAISCSFIGELFDYFNGLEDLEHRIVRFIGNPEQRINEDYLRILRFFRFSNYYSKFFDEPAVLAISKHASGLSKISGERIQTEMFKMILSDRIAETIKTMSNLNIFPFIGISKIDCNIVYNLIEAENILKHSPNLILRLLAIGNNDLDNLIQRWKLPNKIKNELYFFHSKKFALPPDISIKAAKNILFTLGKEKFLNIITLELANNLQSQDLYKNLALMAQEIDIITFPLQGNDLISIGILEGKLVGEMLSKGRTYWEHTDYKATRDEIMTYIKTLNS
ncbi:MAG: CCA tRNA nucleotidyltransferase [Alphaproteobacteria bacterium]